MWTDCQLPWQLCGDPLTGPSEYRCDRWRRWARGAFCFAIISEMQPTMYLAGGGCWVGDPVTAMRLESGVAVRPQRPQRPRWEHQWLRCERGLQLYAIMTASLSLFVKDLSLARPRSSSKPCCSLSHCHVYLSRFLLGAA